jgi:hypothetical protein
MRGSTLRSPRFLLAAAALLAGCGQNLVAPDSVVESAGADAYLDRIAKNCGKLSLGARNVEYVVNFANDAFFLDVTSKFYHGRISAETFADDVNSAFLRGDNGPAIRCMIAQRGPQ